MESLQGLREELEAIRASGLWKSERFLASPQGARVLVRGADGTEREALNLCANNYLGLADSPRLVAAAHAALDRYGLGMASVRFICGSSALHERLEAALADYLGGESALLYAACFDANGGLFEPLFGAEDAIVSDSLNHASIIDGIRLSKAKRFRYPNRDLDACESCLREARAGGARRVVVATDGVFSMDGYFAPLAEIRALADRYDAWVMVDDCHATGFVGPAGAGTPARAGVKVELLTGTLGKALGGSVGGYTVASEPVVALLRQRSRPYLFSNALPPALTAAALEAIVLVREADGLRERLFANARLWRGMLESAGFSLLAGEHPIVPVMLGDAEASQNLAQALWEEGIFVSPFGYPVVPKGAARIRTQMSAALAEDDLTFAAEAFRRCGVALGLV